MANLVNDLEIIKRLRTGIGVDVHAFPTNLDNVVSDLPLAVACLQWQEAPRLVGHSDGDVVAHAVCDAVLSACNLGDIGSNFGTANPEYKNCSGERFLELTAIKCAEAGWEIINVSVQLIGEKPRVATRRAQAQEALAKALGAPVTFSATTTDKLGFLGQEQGLAAVANALVYKK